MTPRLTQEQKAQLPQLLAKGAEAYGFRREVWTASRVAEVIKRIDCGCAIIAITLVDPCAKQAGAASLLFERATQRNEEAIKQWYEKRWSAIKKRPLNGNLGLR